jgi:hypothetical protein
MSMHAVCMVEAAVYACVMMCEGLCVVLNVFKDHITLNLLQAVLRVPNVILC